MNERIAKLRQLAEEMGSGSDEEKAIASIIFATLGAYHAKDLGTLVGLVHGYARHAVELIRQKIQVATS